MANVNESSDYANFLLFKQYLDSQNHGNPQSLPGPQLLPNQVRRAAPQLSPTHPRPQPNRQPPLRVPADILTFCRQLDDIKKRQEETWIAVGELRKLAIQIKTTVDDGVARMVGTMERFEHIGRGVLEMAVQPSNPQPSNGASSHLHVSNPPQPSQYASQPTTSSNSQRVFSGTNTAPPPHTQHHYAPPVSQAPEPFAEPYVEYSGFEFLVNDTS